MGIDPREGGWDTEEDELRIRWALSEARLLLKRYSGLREQLQVRDGGVVWSGRDGGVVGSGSDRGVVWSGREVVFPGSVARVQLPAAAGIEWQAVARGGDERSRIPLASGADGERCLCGRLRAANRGSFEEPVG